MPQNEEGYNVVYMVKGNPGPEMHTGPYEWSEALRIKLEMSSMPSIDSVWLEEARRSVHKPRFPNA